MNFMNYIFFKQRLLINLKFQDLIFTQYSLNLMSTEVSDKAEDGKRGICLGEFLEKHPEIKEKVEEHFQKKSKKWKDEKGGEGQSKHHSHHSQLPNCTVDEDCTNNTICCKLRCGAMKCVNPIFSEKDIKWLHKDDKEKSRNKREAEEISDKAKDGQRGMCLGEYLEKHPELKEKVEEHFQKKSKKWKDEKGGEGHSKHHSHHSKLPNCTVDEDCTNNTICCKLRCGAMKCVNPIFSEKDIKWLHKDDKEKSRNKRESEEVSDKAEDGKRGMCFGEYLEKHPELKEKMEEHFQKKNKKWNEDKDREGHSKHHSHHFSNLQNCTGDEDCSNNTICCKTRHGSMKCMKPIFSKKDIKWLHDDDDKEKSRDEHEEVSDKAEDGKRGMCFGEFLEKHPELKEKVEEHFRKKSKNWKEDQGGEGNSKHHFHHFSNLQNCTADEDCSNNTICCKTHCGAMKCVKPIFSEKDIKWLHRDDKKKSGNKRESEAEKDIKWLHDDDKEKSRKKREAEEPAHDNVDVEVVEYDEKYGTYGKLEAHAEGYGEGEEHNPKKVHKKGFKRQKAHPPAPIKGQGLVDETYIKQESNGKPPVKQTVEAQGP
ncbi:hypothetical protein XELAEV_18034492mg [Xenopus laevis]|uniref:WAP domain-containing protein n=1 Tax=Xenopus laevis TaxID=8355 RepID=A0A974CG60_XENLA|nr:hypothetical protein XELAEV_18034492mg [Xenopus laevis]